MVISDIPFRRGEVQFQVHASTGNRSVNMSDYAMAASLTCDQKRPKVTVYFHKPAHVVVN